MHESDMALIADHVEAKIATMMADAIADIEKLKAKVFGSSDTQPDASDTQPDTPDAPSPAVPLGDEPVTAPVEPAPDAPAPDAPADAPADPVATPASDAPPAETEQTAHAA